jgi:hypothetical protein
MTAVPRSLANRRFSRPSPRAGLLLCAKHLFAGAMVAGAHPGLPPIGKSEDRGAIRIRSREVFRGKSKASPLTRGCAAVHWQIDLLPPQDLLLCARHLFVAAMVAWVRVSGNSEHDGRAVRVRSREMLGSKAKCRRDYAWLTRPSLALPLPQAGLIALRQTLFVPGGWGSTGSWSAPLIASPRNTRIDTAQQSLSKPSPETVHHYCSTSVCSRATTPLRNFSRP